MAPLKRFALAACSVVLVAGCGDDITDVSAGVDDLNRTLEPAGVRADCPSKVDGGEGTKFECTLRNVKSGRSAKIELRLVEQEGDLAVDIAHRRAYDRALEEVTGG